MKKLLLTVALLASVGAQAKTYKWFTSAEVTTENLAAAREVQKHVQNNKGHVPSDSKYIYDLLKKYNQQGQKPVLNYIVEVFADTPK